ncbi:MAG TPA: hypothetical protein VGM50_10070 [Gemmatimonadaceae bacterium]
MSTSAIASPVVSSRTAPRILRAGLLTAFTDACFSSVLVVFFYHSSFARLWQGVASTVLGPSALQGGGSTVAIGVLMHIGVALGWSAVFVLLVMRLGFVQRLLASRAGVIKVAVWFGPLIWVVMSCVVIPALTHRPSKVNSSWWTQFVGHFVFVGLPIVWAASDR